MGKNAVLTSNLGYLACSRFNSKTRVRSGRDIDFERRKVNLY